MPDALHRIPIGRRRPNGRAADALADRVGAMIAAGEIAQGHRLPPERDLMQHFQVSRTVVREAIAKLASRGLIEARPGYRPVVRKPDYDAAMTSLSHMVGHLVQDPDGVRDLFESRIFIEAALARQAAKSARREDIEDLRSALERNRRAIGDSDAFYATDVAFHAVLYRLPRNSVYPGIHRAYVEWLMSLWAAMHRSADVDRVNHAGHVAIFEAILDRDPDAAEAAVRRHLEVAWELVRSTFATPVRTAPVVAAEAVVTLPHSKETVRTSP
jgi:GntR family transcriptional regulator, sialic acid-inducible nan operon repressor